MHRSKLVFGIILVLCFLSACSDTPGTLNHDNSESNQREVAVHKLEEDSPKPSEAKPIDIVISAVGDIMIHGTQLTAQYDNHANEYDFTNNFSYVKPYLEQADLTLANLETVMAGKEKEYTSFPLFNTPDALADALKSTGFDVIYTANNHSLDRGKEGLIRTVGVLKERRLGVIGTKAKENDESYLIQDVNGIKVGLSSFTYETPRVNGKKTINGIIVPEAAADLIDSFGYESLDKDLQKIISRANLLRERGADLIVFYIHWGEEYSRKPNSYQKKIAEELISGGIDIILGCHPHVIQPMEVIKTGSGHKGIVIYSLGNFLSDQRYEFLDRPYTEDGVIVHFGIRKEIDDTIAFTKIAYTPTWVHRYNNGSKTVFEIIPLPDAFEQSDSFNLQTEVNLNKAKKSFENTSHILEQKILSWFSFSLDRLILFI